MASINFFLLLLALLGQPVNIYPPGMEQSTRLLLYQPSPMLPTPVGRTSIASYHLQGPVAEMQAGFSLPQDKGADIRSLLQTIQFDTHGNLTQLIRYELVIENAVIEKGVREKVLSWSIVNQYDDQERLKQFMLTSTEAQMTKEKVTIEAQRIYDEQGHLSQVKATFTGLTDTQNQLMTLTTFDSQGRLAESIVSGEDDKMERDIFTSTYKYEPGNLTVVTSTFGIYGANQQQQFNADGLLTELQLLDAKRKITSKTFFEYNTQGDVIGMSEYRSGQWKRIAFADYVYDKYHNWLERTLYSIQQKDGKDIRSIEAKQYRTITYRQ